MNKDGRSWSIPNLWVCDGSLFPTSGGVNPSLTIQALACRIGDRIADHGEARRAVRKPPAAIASIDDLRKRAHARVPKPFMDYMEAGSFAQITLRENRRDLDSIRFRERVMFDVSAASSKRRCSAKGQHAGGDRSRPACAARSGRTARYYRAAPRTISAFPSRLSTNALLSIEDVASSVDRPFWFQLYLEKDRGFSKELLERAEAAGCPALILTMDLHVEGTRYCDVHNGLGVPPKLTPANIWSIVCTRTGPSRCSIRSAGASAITRTR